MEVDILLLMESIVWDRLIPAVSCLLVSILMIHFALEQYCAEKAIFPYKKQASVQPLTPILPTVAYTSWDRQFVTDASWDIGYPVEPVWPAQPIARDATPLTVYSVMIST